MKVIWRMKINKKWRIIAVLFVFLLFISTAVFLIGKKMDKPPVLKVLPEIAQQEEFQYFISFEDNKYIINPNSISTDKYLSGKKSGKLNGFNAYSPSVLIPVPTNDSTEMSDINIKFWINPTTTVINTVLVFSIVDQNNNQVHWEGFPVKGNGFAADNWYCFNNKFVFPDKFVNTGYSIKVYLWNKDETGSPVYLDDLSISFKESNKEESPRSKLVDFESTNDKKISSKYAKSGFYSAHAKGPDDFAATITVPFTEINIDNISSISFSFNYLSETEDLNAVFVVSVCDSTNKDLLWQGVDLSVAKFTPKTWETANGNVIIPAEVAKPENKIKIYLWNRNENEVYIDDIYIVIKEKNLTGDTVQPAVNLIESKKFQPKSNHPPYDVQNLYLDKSLKTNADLNRIFTKNSRVLTGKFDQTNSKDQILISQNGKHSLLSFIKNEAVFKEVKFKPEITNNSILQSDRTNVFSININEDYIIQYRFDKKTSGFNSVCRIDYKDSDKVIYVNANDDNSISIFENDGYISTYKSVKGTYTLSTRIKMVAPQQGSLKILKADFFNTKDEQALLIYLENGTNKYVFLSFDSLASKWKLSDKHQNKSVQSYDKLEFVSEFFVFDYDKSGQKELLQFKKNRKFDVKILNFDKITYNILFNIEFKGFAGKQNPKYYEVSKIVCGDFTGDCRSEIIIYQDNVSKVDWLTQKTEMYSFSSGL